MPKIDRHEPGSFCWLELATSDQNAAKSFLLVAVRMEHRRFPMGPNQVYTMFKLDELDAAPRTR